MGHIVKANRVQLQDSFQLRLDPAAPVRPGRQRAAAGPVGVRLAETHPDFAVIEIACPCGEVTRIRCDYATADAVPPATAAAEQHRTSQP